MDYEKPADLPHVFPDGFLQNNGADMVTLRKFFDYVDAEIPEASEPERILSSVMIPMAAMSNQLVQTGEWYRSIISSRG